MFLRRLKALTGVFVFLLVVACAHQGTSRSQPSIQTGVLWEISKQGQAPSYLFGTIHSEDPRVLKLSPVVKKAFERSDLLALEIAFSQKTSQYALSSMFFVDGRRLSDLVPGPVFEATLREMQDRGLPEDQIALMKPWAVVTLVNMPKSETGAYLDISLWQKAKVQGKQRVGLETIEEQISAFNDMPMDVQIRMLEETLNNQDDFDQVMEQTIKVYLGKDLNEMLSLNQHFMDLMPPDIAKVFEKRIILDRNQRMFERSLPLIERGKAFIAVGALHLPGSNGLIEQYKKQGFTVTPLY